MEKKQFKNAKILEEKLIKPVCLFLLFQQSIIYLLLSRNKITSETIQIVLKISKQNKKNTIKENFIAFTDKTKRSLFIFPPMKRLVPVFPREKKSKQIIEEPRKENIDQTARN